MIRRSYVIAVSAHGKRQNYIPAALRFGEQAHPRFPPNIFVQHIEPVHRTGIFLVQGSGGVYKTQITADYNEICHNCSLLKLVLLLYDKKPDFVLPKSGFILMNRISRV
jgi:hypothetical protein